MFAWISSQLRDGNALLSQLGSSQWAKCGRSICGRGARVFDSWPSGHSIHGRRATSFFVSVGQRHSPRCPHHRAKLIFHPCRRNHFSIMSATTTVISSNITPGFLAKSVLPQPILRRAQFSDYTTDKALSAYLQQMEGDVLNEVKDLLNIYYGDGTQDLGAHRKFSEAKSHFAFRVDWSGLLQMSQQKLCTLGIGGKGK